MDWLKAINNYLKSSFKSPFFLFTGDADYSCVIQELNDFGLDKKRLSDLCPQDDKIPDIDVLFNEMAIADVNADQKSFFLIGIGEFLALKSPSEARSLISQLKDTHTGGAKVVLVLRGLNAYIQMLQSNLHFNAASLLAYTPDASFAVSFTRTSIDALATIHGLKNLLAYFEDGSNEHVYVKTNYHFDHSIKSIDSAYEAICTTIPDFSIPESCGTQEQWLSLFQQLQNTDNSLEELFEQYRFGGFSIEKIYHTLCDRALGWLYFIYLKWKGFPRQPYLQSVLDKTTSSQDLCKNLTHTIIEICPDDPRFKQFYDERKTLVQSIPEPDIAAFVKDNRIVRARAIYRLTNQTSTEKKEIITYLAQPQEDDPDMLSKEYDRLRTIYPELCDYLDTYTFIPTQDSALSTAYANYLTQYFNEYKRQKLTNRITPEFLQKVQDNARTRDYNKLQTRNAVLDAIQKDDRTQLYWIDALGVEYLHLIQTLAEKHDLNMDVHIARASLPTITSLNRDFYDTWNGPKHTSNNLDKIKHNREESDVSPKDAPIHLASEIDIISKHIERIASDLKRNAYNRVILTSDHGTSRLAVIQDQVEKYDCDTKGEHSGRCCKVFNPHDDLHFATEEQGYLVLADYGRFRGGRAAEVEVHGGASLEEVLVPVIAFTLKDETIDVDLLNKDDIISDSQGTQLTFFVDKCGAHVAFMLGDEWFYPTPQSDHMHFDLVLPKLKRPGSYTIKVYVDTTFLKDIPFKSRGRAASINDDFDLD